MDEISPENYVALESRYRATALIITSQIALTIISVITVWLFAPMAASSIASATLTTLWILIIFLAVGAFVLRRIFFRWDRLRDVTLLKGVSGLIETLQSNAVILGVFATLLTIVGCVITILSGETFEMFRAGLVALIVFLINFPRKSVWKKIVAGMEKV